MNVCAGLLPARGSADHLTGSIVTAGAESCSQKEDDLRSPGAHSTDSKVQSEVWLGPWLEEQAVFVTWPEWA